MDKLSKSSLVATIAEKTGYPKKTVKGIVDASFDEIADAIAEGNSVTIQGFGRFFSKEAKERAFRKIHSDEMITIGARDLPKVKFAKTLVDRVKQ